MTTLIKQRTPNCCAVCTIAMATDHTYEEVMAVAGDSYVQGKGTHNEEGILNRLGLTNQFDRSYQPTGDFHTRYKDASLSSEWFRTVAWGRRAIMAVPSLNIEGGFHSIYWDGWEIFDPSTLKTYTEFNQLLPKELILFQERQRPCAT